MVSSMYENRGKKGGLKMGDFRGPTPKMTTF